MLRYYKSLDPELTYFLTEEQLKTGKYTYFFNKILLGFLEIAGKFYLGKFE